MEGQINEGSWGDILTNGIRNLKFYFGGGRPFGCCLFVWPVWYISAWRGLSYRVAYSRLFVIHFVLSQVKSSLCHAFVHTYNYNRNEVWQK
jgi:hypothetical protein